MRLTAQPPLIRPRVCAVGTEAASRREGSSAKPPALNLRGEADLLQDRATMGVKSKRKPRPWATQG